MEVTRPMTQAEYKSEGGTRCPYCKSFDTRTETKHTEDERDPILYVRVRCFSCGHAYRERYKLVGWESG